MSEFNAILALDTSTLTQTVFAANGPERRASRTFHAKRGHTSSLLTSLEAALTEVGLDKRGLDLVAVGLGPGSFTGLRIGVSAAKALCFATQTPIVGVSSLAAMALGARGGHETGEVWVATATDARKREVYGALWAVGDDRGPRAVLPEETWDPAAFAAAVAERASGSSAPPLLGAGSGFAQYASVFEAALGARLDLLPSERWFPHAEAVAELGVARAREAGPDALASLEPRYVRPSDAELNWKEQTR